MIIYDKTMVKHKIGIRLEDEREYEKTRKEIFKIDAEDKKIYEKGKTTNYITKFLEKIEKRWKKLSKQTKEKKKYFKERKLQLEKEK